MARPPCYQCPPGDDLDAIRDKRNAEIRAWGKKQLADADATLLGVPTAESFDSDWDVIVDPEPEPEEEVDSDLIVDADVEVPAKGPKARAPKAG